MNRLVEACIKDLWLGAQLQCLQWNTARAGGDRRRWSLRGADCQQGLPHKPPARIVAARAILSRR